MIKVGIYPGAFDPIHNGHIAFAEAAMKQFGLDKVYLLPEPQPRHKQGVKAFEHRVAMAKIATADNPNLGVIVLEQQRFTIQDTWPILTARFSDAERYMLLGSDVAGRLTSWPHFTELVETAPVFLIALRGEPVSEMHSRIDTMQNVTKLPFTYKLIEPGYPTYRSTTVRATLRAGGVPVSLPQGVLDYITKHKLYRSGTA